MQRLNVDYISEIWINQTQYSRRFSDYIWSDRDENTNWQRKSIPNFSSRYKNGFLENAEFILQVKYDEEDKIRRTIKFLKSDFEANCN